MTLADLNTEVNSAHAFWVWPLHDEHGSAVEVLARSNGNLEVTCHQCKKLLGVLKLDRGET